MDYQTAIAYLYGFTDFERDPGHGQISGIFGLDRIAAFLHDLDDPQFAYPVIHLAGTKGKGSTAALAEAILRRAGLRTGLFTSPHLHDFAERIRIDGQPIAPSQIAGALEALRPRLEPLRRPASAGGLTTFEITTALAFDCFRRSEVDVAIVETGLGGRLDSTNVVRPAVAAITAIGLDHTAILGDNLTAIAGEKAGILKPGTRVVIGRQPAEALAVLRARCAEIGVRPRIAGEDYWMVPDRPTPDGQGVTIVTPAAGARPYRTRLPLIGYHQAENAADAVAIVEEFRAAIGPGDRAAGITRSAIEKGLAGVAWPGRFQILHRQPWLIADGAHTGESADRLAETLAELWPGRPVTFVVGVSRDKPVETIARALAPVAGEFVAIEADHPRALPAATVRDRIAAAGGRCRIAGSTQAALAGWWATADADAIAVATGSLFVAAEAIRWPVPATSIPRSAIAVR